MSFKREGDDWSQLNVLKVGAEECFRSSFTCPLKAVKELFCCCGNNWGAEWREPKD